MSRAYNFCAGPAALPEAVLKKAQEELLDWQHKAGCSVMEMSHRSAEFTSIIEQAEQDFRQLLAIPDHYKVLFMQGGASAQFSAVPLNLLRGKQKADYFNTGQWSKKAIAEAKRYCDVNIVASSEDKNFSYAPSQQHWQLSADAAYVHYVHNETIGGVEFPQVPEVGDKPLVADMSSTILSRPIDVNKFGLIYAGAQKNIGPAGITLVIVDEALLGYADEKTPTMLNYEISSKNASLYNTPPTFAVYLAGLVFQWLRDLGGLEAMAEINQRKAEKLYGFIDQSGFYNNPVEKNDRSWMNVPFTLADDSLDKTFLAQAEAHKLLNLKGHRSVGGMRASIYNAVPEQAVDALIDFMRQFEAEHG